MQMTIRLLKCCDSKAIKLVSVHLPGVHNIQVDSLSRVGQTLTMEWTMAMETRVCQVGRATDRLVCDIRQQTTRQVRIAVSGPRAEWTDAMSMPWDYGRDLLVRVPVIQDGPTSTAEDRTVTRSGGDFDRSTATGSIMVPRVDGPIPRRSDSTVRRRSRPTDTRRLDRRRGDRERHFRPCGNSPGHPESKGSFEGSCQHDVKVPSGIFTTSVWWIPLVKIRGVL